MLRWRILGLLFLARIGLGFQFQTVASMGDEFIVAFGLDYVGIGLMIGLAMGFGWQVPFQVASVYCLIAAIAVLVFYRPPHDLPQAQGGPRAVMTGKEWRLVICAASAGLILPQFSGPLLCSGKRRKHMANKL